MTDNIKKLLESSDGMALYDYVANNAENDIEELQRIVERLREVDSTGQFLASTARFLNAIDSVRYRQYLPALLEGAIEKDKERKYIGSLLESIWGDDYMDKADQLKEEDQCFRKIYQRIYQRKV